MFVGASALDSNFLIDQPTWRMKGDFYRGFHLLRTASRGFPWVFFFLRDDGLLQTLSLSILYSLDYMLHILLDENNRCLLLLKNSGNELVVEGGTFRAGLQ